MEKIIIDKVIRSRRTTLSLIIERDATVIVRAPLRMPMKDINAFVLGKRDWIATKQEEIRRRLSQKRKRQFVEGETFLYLGNAYELLIKDNCTEPLSLDLFNFILDRKYEQQARRVFVIWYLNRAYYHFFYKAKEFSEKAGVRFAEVKLSRAETRWGSCSSKGNLNLNWKLVMAPPKVIDYIVAHEVAHLEEMNHSQRFWSKVEAIMPDYKPYKNWIKKNGHLLEF